MKRTALIACAALMTATAAPAFAGSAPASEAPRPATRASQPTTPLLVALCDRDALTQAAFRNNYGPRPVFVTANQVMNARATGERWSEQRCMTVGQHQRLTQLLNARPSR